MDLDDALGSGTSITPQVFDSLGPSVLPSFNLIPSLLTPDISWALGLDAEPRPPDERCVFESDTGGPLCGASCLRKWPRLVPSQASYVRKEPKSEKVRKRKGRKTIRSTLIYPQGPTGTIPLQIDRQ